MAAGYYVPRVHKRINGKYGPDRETEIVCDMKKYYQAKCSFRDIFILFLPIFLIFTFSACTHSPEETKDRTTGEVVTAEEGESLTNSFFEFEVLDAEPVELEGRSPGKDRQFVRVTLRIKNVWDTAIPMGADFDVSWQPYEADSEEESSRPISQQLARALPTGLQDSYTLEKDEEISGDLLFSVPTDSDLWLIYTEEWSDDFVGNTYEIPFHVHTKTEVESQ